MDASILIDILFRGNIKDAILTLAGEAVQNGLDYMHVKGILNQAIKKYLSIQNADIRKQLEAVIEESKEELLEQIQNKNIYLLTELNNQLEDNFQRYEIPIDSRENLKNNLLLFILDSIQDIDPNFVRDLKLMQKIIEEQQQRALQDGEIQALKEQIRLIQYILQNILQERLSPIEVAPSQPQIDDPSKIVGHENILKNIQAMYDGGSNVVFLYGRPGMGKTTLAKRYARMVCNERDVFFVEYEESIEHTVAKLAKGDLKEGGKKVLSYWEKGGQERPVLLVIDNFDGNTLQRASGQNTEEELQGKYYKALVNTGVHVLFTTRTRREQNAVEVTPIEEAFQLFEKPCGSTIVKKSEKEIIEEILQVIQNNTLLIILVANILKRFDIAKKAREILDRLKNCNMQEESTKIGVYADIQDREAQTIYEQTYALLDMSGIRENSAENIIFANAILLPLDGMKKQDFLTLIENENDNAMMNLIGNSWILTDSEAIYLHPMVKEIALRSGFVSAQFCENYCKNIKKKIAIGAKFDERIKYKKYAQEIFKIFNSSNLLNLDLLRLFYDLSDIYDELGERGHSLEIAKVIESNIHLYDGNPIEKVRVMSGVAYSFNNCYDSMETLDKAHSLLDQALQTLETIMDLKQTDRREYAQMRSRIISNFGSNYLAKSKCNQERRIFNLNQALEVHRQALEIRQMEYERLLTEPQKAAEAKAAIAISHTTIATDCFYLQNYEEAIAQHEKALEIRDALNNSKGVSISQQRITGCIIEMYKQNLFIDEKYIVQALSYFPELFKLNYEHQNMSALKDNVRYWEKLRNIVLNDRRLERYVKETRKKHEDFVGWVNADEKLKKVIGNDVLK
ncbi:MAG: ATP-binding protein [Bacteroidales bacterium]|nr:ATP-binding protein [Lachnoclostridium sp.]MCM1384707.1 ATP-binding protein [Lachnoclostridium sp.]MCM1465279.1 ATP-binding protein [Bacteroidales bacterium]